MIAWSWTEPATSDLRATPRSVSEKRPVLRLVEDPAGCEGSKEAVRRVRVAAHRRGNVLGAPRPIGERVGDAQRGGHRHRLGQPHAGEDAPDLRGGLG